ncbi:MAG: hypothetical protein HFJ35_08470 [Clostridia bacterium]|nr:hypothetical protein [Clostridia bacterium]
MNMVELPGGGYATESEALTALAAEAKRRGISYGHLVANTTERERTEIIRDYCAEKRRKGRKKG